MKTQKEKDIIARIKMLRKNLSTSYGTSPEAKRDAKSRIHELCKELIKERNSKK